MTMINITIDGKAISVPKGTTVYQATKQLGIDIPIFCYQDRMPPFGACRVCLVEVEKMGKLQTSCTLVALEGMVVHTQSNSAVNGRKGILELLLVNHPLDCPICDRAGECPLQDQTLKYGPGLSRFFEEKRRFPKHLPLGPVLMLDRERCIVCARCTRFSDLIAGDHALEFKERGYRTEVGTPESTQAESKFIGNTIMICPVGALTSQIYRFRARPWDNDHTHTTCTLCPIGCSETLDSRDGEIMRTRSCENKDLNDIWLCDKGWFGYEFVDHPDRLRQPLIRKNNQLTPSTWEEAITLIATKFQTAKKSEKIAALGGNPLTLEENYLFQKFIREGGGVNHVDHRVGMTITPLNEEIVSPGMEITVGDCEKLSLAIIFGADLTEEFPVIWLRLKQAINCGAKVLFFGHFSPEIAPHLTKTILHAPGKELEILRQYMPQLKAQLEQSCEVGESCEDSTAIFIGRQYLASPERQAILSELLELKNSNFHTSLNLLEGRGNSLGARWAGMRPDLKPCGEVISNPGLNALQIIEKASTEPWDYLHIAGADPAAKYPAEQWGKVRKNLDFLVVQDIFLTETAKQADVVLPTLSYVEKQGTFINIEGKARKIAPGKQLPEGLYSDEEIFSMLARKLNIDISIEPSFLDRLTQRVPPKSSVARSQDGFQERKTGLSSHTEDNGTLFASFTYSLFDHGVRMKHNQHLNKLTKAPRVRIHPLEGIKRGIQNDQTIRLTANGHTIEASVHLDERIAANTIVLPLGFPELPVHNLNPSLLNGTPVKLKA